jgi:uncharacterized glyoxalase superfamily protein PhnB
MCSIEIIMDSKEPHICLYRDSTEIILTSANCDRVNPNRELYGYGYDVYFITDDQQALQKEFSEKGAKIVRPLQKTDYHNQEFVVEDIDGVDWVRNNREIKRFKDKGAG